MCGDSTQKEQVLRLMNNQEADMLLTDPPYNVDYEGKTADALKIEEELTSLEEADKKEMLEALGLKESGLDRVIRESYSVLGLMSFLTAGEPEVRAWTIKKGTKAPVAAGKIHSDIQRGFIKAEVMNNEKIRIYSCFGCSYRYDDRLW